MDTLPKLPSPWKATMICYKCQVDHVPEDIAKFFDDGDGLCRICAYCHSNRAERRKAPKEEVCTIRCWK